MSERKVLNKYYPPDFDPLKLTKVKRAKEKQDNVRMMLPMSVRCNTCGNFMYIGTKFNMRKETCNDDDYLGIKIFRFYFKCSRCYAEITMKTDPKNHDYICEHGATRNYEPWRDIQHAETVLKAKRALEDSDAMKNLENRTYDSKREMAILDALEEVKQLNRRLAKVNHEELLLKTLAKYNDDPDEKARDEEAVRAAYRQRLRQTWTLNDEDEGEYEDGDNFDRYVTSGKAFRLISNPYELLEQMEKAFDLRSSSESEEEEKHVTKVIGSLNPLKRKEPERSVDGMFKVPFSKLKRPCLAMKVSE